MYGGSYMELRCTQGGQQELAHHYSTSSLWRDDESCQQYGRNLMLYGGRLWNPFTSSIDHVDLGFSSYGCRYQAGVVASLSSGSREPVWCLWTSKSLPICHAAAVLLRVGSVTCQWPTSAYGDWS